MSIPKKITKVKFKKNNFATFRYGTRETVADTQMYGRIRRKLGLKSHELKHYHITRYINMLNKALMEWIVNDPDGFRLPKLGYIVASKWKNRANVVDMDEVKKRIENDTTISESRRKTLMERFTYSSERKVPQKVAFDYLYRIMWFNKRNCMMEKAKVYKLLPIQSAASRVTQFGRSGQINYKARHFNEYYLPYYKCDE